MIPRTTHWACVCRGFFLGAALFYQLPGGMGTGTAFAAGASNSLFDVRKVEAGLEQTTITAVVQTRDGYLWLGTYHGLVRFDGVRSVVFDSNNTPGLKNSRVTCLYEDNQGVLWIGDETGELTRFSSGVFSSVALGNIWPGGTIEAISTDENGDLWLLNDRGFLFRPQDGQSAGPAEGGSTIGQTSLTRQRNGKLWFVSNGKVATIDRGKLSPFFFDDPTQANYYQKVFPARDGGLWVVGSGRVKKWHAGKWVEDLSDYSIERDSLTVAMETRSGALLAGTLKNGLYLLAPGAEPLHFNRTNGLSHDWVRSLWEDHEGNIWIGTAGGFDTLRARKVTMLNPPDDWQGRTVRSFTVLPDGSAWIGTEGAGLYHYQGQEWTQFSESSGLSNLFVWSVLETRQHELFAGTWGGGMLVKNGARFESRGELAKITAPVLALYEGQNGVLWIGTKAGLHRSEAGKLTWFLGKDKLVLPDVRAIAETAEGTIWFGMSGGGLGRLKDGTLKQFRKQDGLSSNIVLSLYAEPDGTLWIGTGDSGLARFREGKFSTISAVQGLASSEIGQIVDDGVGSLWMGSRQGILRARKAELHKCADGLVTLIQCLTYGKSEGLASETCSGGFQPGACRTADGRLWFPTARGLAIIDPVNVATNPVVPPVVIEELIVDGKAVEHGISETNDHVAGSRSPLRIPPGKHRFDLRYTGLSFAAPEKVRFKYKLDGLEKDWGKVGTQRSAQYSYLQPGAYTFHVIACNNDDGWNETGASLAFIVLPHVWQTWWFRVLAGLAAAAAIAGSVLVDARRRTRRKLELVKRQRAIEHERARIARDIHDDLGASLTRITMLSQTVRSELGGGQPAAADVDQIYSTARELTRAMDEIVWAVNPQHDTLDSLVTYLGRFAQSYLSAAGIRCRLRLPVELPPWPLTAEVRHNLFLACKESLHNVVKHAAATEVQVSLKVEPTGFVLSLKDNGCGFQLESPASEKDPDPARTHHGNGLGNIRRRLQEIGGEYEIKSAPRAGTNVIFLVPIKISAS